MHKAVVLPAAGVGLLIIGRILNSPSMLVGGTILVIASIVVFYKYIKR